VMTRRDKAVRMMGRPATEMIGQPGTRLLNLPDVAGRLRTNVRTVQRLIQKGILTPVRLPGIRRTLLVEADIDRLIAASRGRTKGGR
jgi:hypothetical protein